MDAATHRAHLRRELDAFRACLDGDLSAPVRHCGDWTLRDLTAHLADSNQWAAAAVTERRGDRQGAPVPEEPGALVRWFDDSCTSLLAALDTDPSAPAWTFHPPHTVGFWQRRRALETLVHRWDAENALGAAGPLDPELASDGVAEVFEIMAPRQIVRGRASEPTSAFRLVAEDTGRSWVHGPGAPVATLSGTAENLLLTLWGRLPADSEACAWEGDEPVGRRLLAGPLVP